MKVTAVLFVLAAVACASQRPPDADANARAIVERFCEMDADGLALSSTTAPPMWALTDGAGYENEETARAIAGFQVVSAERGGTEVLVRVRYKVLAEMHFDVMRVQDADVDWVFHVVETKSGWRIATGHFGDYMPRITYIRALVLARHLENIVSSPAVSVSGEARDQDTRYRGYVAQLRDLERAVNAKEQ